MHEYLFPEKDENVILQFDLENWPNFRQMRFSPKVTLHLMKALMKPSLLQTDFVCDFNSFFILHKMGKNDYKFTEEIPIKNFIFVQR